jgi:hypothetical protein
MGGKFHPKLNTGERPIANKYREGKVKRTLKRESKVLETVGREGVSTSIHLLKNQKGSGSSRSSGDRELISGWASVICKH